jgi:surface antigen
MNRENLELSVSGSFAHKLKLINPNWKLFVPGHCTYFVAKYWNVQWKWHAKDWYKNAQKAGYKTGNIAQPGAIVVWHGPGYNLTYGHVAIVMSVNAAEWTMVVKDMNYTGLWRVTTRTENMSNKYIIGFIYDQLK